jgi:AcrR family transcriptional regulator
MTLNRDRIVQSALRLLDEVGLEALSLRRLASDLDVHASALYWHFRNKQELLDEMARAVATPIPAEQMPATGAPAWDAWLRLTAQAWRRAMLSHRDGALLLTAARPPDDQVADLERLLDVLVGRASHTPMPCVASSPSPTTCSAPCSSSNAAPARTPTISAARSGRVRPFPLPGRPCWTGM